MRRRKRELAARRTHGAKDRPDGARLGRRPRRHWSVTVSTLFLGVAAGVIAAIAGRQRTPRSPEQEFDSGYESPETVRDDELSAKPPPRTSGRATAHRRHTGGARPARKN